MPRHALAPLLLLCCFCWSCSALAIAPRIYEQDDFGDISWSEFTYSISADCNASTISVKIMNESVKPVKDANIYLQYVDFSTPLIANVVSDKDGNALIRLPGNTRLMRGLFVLVIEKKGFRSKEVHFDLSPCFSSSTIPSPPSKPPGQNATNTTKPPPPPPKNNTTISTPSNATPSNATNGSAASNGTGNGSGAGSGASAPCAISAALALIALIIVFKPMNG